MTAPFPGPDPFTQEATVSAWVRADVGAARLEAPGAPGAQASDGEAPL